MAAMSAGLTSARIMSAKGEPRDLRRAMGGVRGARGAGVRVSHGSYQARGPRDLRHAMGAAGGARGGCRCVAQRVVLSGAGAHVWPRDLRRAMGCVQGARGAGVRVSHV